jgi:hypothetical protein
MRKTMTVAAIAALLIVSGATLLFAHHGPAKVSIDAAAKKQPAVAFDHATHVKRAKTCETCHHTEKGLTNETDKNVKKCSSCHLNPKDAKVPNMAEMSMTKNPFHMACVNCHKTGKKGPTVCKDCHKK